MAWLKLKLKNMLPVRILVFSCVQVYPLLSIFCAPVVSLGPTITASIVVCAEVGQLTAHVGEFLLPERAPLKPPPAEPSGREL